MMSIEEQLSNAVQATNNLTAAVNNKIGQIDQKVNEATSAVPNVVRGLMHMTLYVDAVDGNDANTGLATSKLQTIKAAIDKAPGNSIVTIILTIGQEHIVNSVIECKDKSIIFLPSYYSSNKPTVKATSYISGGMVFIGCLKEPREVNLYYTNLSIGDYADDNTPENSISRGFIVNGDKPINVQFSMAVGKLEHAGYPVMDSSGRPSVVSASLVNVTYERKPTVRTMRKTFTCFGGNVFVGSLALVNALNSDLISVNKDQFGSVTNVNSNFDLSL